MCVYVCMYACMCAWLDVCVCMYVCMHVCMIGCVCACMHACMHDWMCVCMHACMYAGMHTCMHDRICVRMIIHTTDHGLRKNIKSIMHTKTYAPSCIHTGKLLCAHTNALTTFKHTNMITHCTSRMHSHAHASADTTCKSGQIQMRTHTPFWHFRHIFNVHMKTK